MNNIVTFKTNKEIDIANHLEVIDSYAKGGKPFNNFNKARFDALVILSHEERVKFLNQELYDFYDPEKQAWVDVILDDINNLWQSIETDFVQRIELIHHKKFEFQNIRGYLSTATRFSYDFNKNIFVPVLRIINLLW